MNKLTGVALVIGAVVITATGGLGAASAAKGGGAAIRTVSYWEVHDPPRSYDVVVTTNARAKVRKVEARLVRPGGRDVRGRAVDKDHYPGGASRRWFFAHEFERAVRADVRGGKCSWPGPERCVAKVKVRASRGKKTLDTASCKLELEDWSDPSLEAYGARCSYPRSGH